MAEPDRQERPDGANADALDASVRLARLRRQMFARVETPQIGQYHVLRQIGGGGMGLVFAAWDPTLDRVVAIKVLRDPWSGAGAELRREALALAKLRHPNVVSVFEIGDHDGQVFLAMEYVEGKTLRQWMRAWRNTARPDHAALLDVFQQAAQGLAAAHSAGLVHRDIKPENMMLDQDGRVRVMDFGLARRHAVDDITATERLDGKAPESAPPEATHSVGLYGTPAYMAPEQFDAALPGPAADQFALCACIFEALYGKRARPGKMEAAAFAAGEPIVLARDRRVPKALARVVQRGLALTPGDRWPSMRALADELEKLGRPRAPRWALASAGIAVAGTLALGLAVSSQPDAACTGAAAELAGVWGPERAAALAETAANSNAGFAAAAITRTSVALDRYAEAWKAGHRDACEATRVRQEASEALMDQRMACLQDRRRHLAALVDVLRGGSRDAIARADRAVSELPAIARCGDADLLAQQGYRGSGKPTSEALGKQLAFAAALQSSGDSTGSQAAATDALALAVAEEDPVGAARAQLAIGRAQASLLASFEARDTLIKAYELARSASLPTLAADAAIILIRVCGVQLSDHDEGQWWLRLAELERPALGDRRQRVRLERAAALMLYEAGRGAEAKQRVEDALALLAEVADFDPLETALTELELGRLTMRTGESAAGAARVRDAASALREALGPEHPENATAEAALSHAATLRGQMRAAVTHAEAAVGLAESAVGRDHISLSPHLIKLAHSYSDAGEFAKARTTLERATKLSSPRPIHGLALAKVHGALGQLYSVTDPAKALEHYERAHEISRTAVGEHHRLSVRFLVAKGTAQGEAGRLNEAMETIRVGLAIGTTALGSDHPDVALIHHALALQYGHAGKFEKALHHHQAMLEVAESNHGADSYPMVAAHGNVCVTLVRLERYDAAVPQCRRALEIAATAVGDSNRARADIRNALAAALLKLGFHDEAVATFQAARDDWQAAMGPRTYEESLVIANLAGVAEEDGEFDEAIALFREALSIREERLGADHPATKIPREGLARTLAARGANRPTQ
ncbi:MAG: serine/threonine-protein kinase [Myxococcota bacterium]